MIRRVIFSIYTWQSSSSMLVNYWGGMLQLTGSSMGLLDTNHARLALHSFLIEQLT